MATINSPKKISKQGKMGELIVKAFLEDKDQTVVMSENKFDPEKDMISDGRTVEVKTQVPFYLEDAFTVQLDQEDKMNNVDLVYWLSVPFRNKPDKYAGCIFEMDPKIATYYKVKVKDAREIVFAYKREQEGMKVVGRIFDKEVLNALVNASSSAVD